MRMNGAIVGLILLAIGLGNSFVLIDVFPEDLGVRISIISVYLIVSTIVLVRGFRKIREGQLTKFTFMLCLSAFTLLNTLQMIATSL